MMGVKEFMSISPVNHSSLRAGIKKRGGEKGGRRKVSYTTQTFLLLAFVVLVTCLAGTGSLAQSSYQYQYMGWVNHQQSVHPSQIPFEDRKKLLRVFAQLQKYSGKIYTVYAANTNKIGIAKPGGIILMDLETMHKPEPVLAFWLAHEWGHQDLGHAPNAQSPIQATYAAFVRRKYFPTSSEDEADRYAARFLARTGIDIQPALHDLCALPASAAGKQHRPAWQRAMTVAMFYSRISGKAVKSPCLPAIRYPLHIAAYLVR